MTQLRAAPPGLGTSLVVRTPRSYTAERRHALDVVLSEWLGFAYDLEFEDGPKVAILLAGDSRGRELTLPDVFFAIPTEDWLTERSMPVRPLTRCAATGTSAGPLPVLFGGPIDTGPVWHATPAGLALEIDILGSVFFLLTRYEEIVRRTRDEHERFPASASLAAIEGFLERPLADEYVDVLWAAMHSLWPELTRRPSTFRLRLTHDVDQPWASWGQPPGSVARSVAGDLLRRRDPVLAARRARSFLDARTGRVDRDPLNTFDLIMDTSERHNLRSAFYFMAGNGPGDSDFRYRLTDPPFECLLRRIHERGHEVGLHASYGSHRSSERTRAEADALRDTCSNAGFDQPVWGVRQHYLRFENPQTWRNQESAGLEHDSTLGFAEQIGFRAGTCREYPVFDLLDRRPLNLRERPLIVMDGTLLGYLRLGPEEATSRARALVDVCRRHQGDAVLLYHNDTLAGERQRAHYRELIQELTRL